jgi:hypothetical protein
MINIKVSPRYTPPAMVNKVIKFSIYLLFSPIKYPIQTPTKRARTDSGINTSGGKVCILILLYY